MPDNPILARRILRAWAETPGIDTGKLLGEQLDALSKVAAREAGKPVVADDMSNAQTAAFAGMVAILFAIAAWIMAWAWRIGGAFPLRALMVCTGIWGVAYLFANYRRRRGPET